MPEEIFQCNLYILKSLSKVSQNSSELWIKSGFTPLILIYKLLMARLIVYNKNTIKIKCYLNF